MDDPRGDWGFCRAVLPRVSRTFGLVIPLLPGPVKRPVTVAYLLCRIADTIEDTGGLSRGGKIEALGRFRDHVLENDGRGGEFGAGFEPESAVERSLMRQAPRVLREAARLAPDQRAVIEPIVAEMCEGMSRFAYEAAPDAAPPVRVAATLEQLEQYCYYVAGTVGVMLAQLFALHHAGSGSPASARTLELAIRYGIGLQLTNIVNDRASDAVRGVTFLPAGTGSDPGVIIARARECLDSGLEFCTRIPRRQYRIRMFCQIPLYLALRTLRLRRREAETAGGGHRSIGRRAVYGTTATTALIAPFDGLTRRYFRSLDTG